MQIMTTMRCHFLSAKMAVVKVLKDNSKCWGEYGGKGNLQIVNGKKF